MTLDHRRGYITCSSIEIDVLLRACLLFRQPGLIEARPVRRFPGGSLMCPKGVEIVP